MKHGYPYCLSLQALTTSNHRKTMEKVERNPFMSFPIRNLFMDIKRQTK